MDGNLNVTLHQQDTSSHMATPPDNRHGRTPRLLHHHQLTDCWRALNPMAGNYTFYLQTHTSYSRLHYFLVPHNYLTLLVESEILPMTWSDHNPVHLQLKSYLFRPRQSSWRLNESILSDTYIIEKAKQAIQDYFSANDRDIPVFRNKRLTSCEFPFP
ncbi:Hypothetical predicted protein [Pelobates cultripes]|uniref:Endonuclease/exonuclease/phosphatase domain-containing protein n=1 Tax=Pelobates cultripes TaxID=61616 RepID=A0AAD1S6E2_PELCU|nr:Hypothetical predicted protein [Pelobates cultripes]